MPETSMILINHEFFFRDVIALLPTSLVDYLSDPMSSVCVPVFDSFDTKKPVLLIVSCLAAHQ
jgi:hypothetical protein